METASTIFHLMVLLKKTPHELKQMKAALQDHFAPQLHNNYINYTDIEKNYVTLSGKNGRGKVKCTRALPACGASDNFFGCEDRAVIQQLVIFYRPSIMSGLQETRPTSVEIWLS